MLLIEIFSHQLSHEVLTKEFNVMWFFVIVTSLIIFHYLLTLSKNKKEQLNYIGNNRKKH